MIFLKANLKHRFYWLFSFTQYLFIYILILLSSILRYYTLNLLDSSFVKNQTLCINSVLDIFVSFEIHFKRTIVLPQVCQ